MTVWLHRATPNSISCQELCLYRMQSLMSSDFYFCCLLLSLAHCNSCFVTAILISSGLIVYFWAWPVTVLTFILSCRMDSNIKPSVHGSSHMAWVLFITLILNVKWSSKDYLVIFRSFRCLRGELTVFILYVRHIAHALSVN